jgi:protein-S-isoprenylcysteine O-methyltransferase Ste14
VTTRDKVIAILFWTLMVFLAFVMAKMNVVADWFVKMRITAPADGMNGLLNYIPLALVVILFLFVWGVDQGRKSRERTNS